MPETVPQVERVRVEPKHYFTEDKREWYQEIFLDGGLARVCTVTRRKNFRTGEHEVDINWSALGATTPDVTWHFAQVLLRAIQIAKEAS